MGKGTRITSVYAREVFTDRGHPGVEATVNTENDGRGIAISTGGNSTGKYEAIVVIDGGKRWNGMGVSRAVGHVNHIIAPTLKGMDASKQEEIDQVLLELDGTKDKSHLGANATGSVSAAVLKAGAASLGIPLYKHIGGEDACTLPVPGFCIMIGSKRYGAGRKSGAKPTYSVMSYGFKNFREASYATWKIIIEVEKKLGLDIIPGLRVSIPPGKIKHDREFLEILTETISGLGYENKAGIQVDYAADTFYDRKKHKYIGLLSEGEKSKEELIEEYKELVKTYPFIIMEDHLEEDDFKGHAYLKKELGIEIVGDDLFTTNIERVKKGIEIDAAHAVLLKVYQIGTISEAFKMAEFANNHGLSIQPCSSRGEGTDIADYSVGLNAGYVRESALGPRGNRFLKIEDELGGKAKFLGKAAFKGLR